MAFDAVDAAQLVEIDRRHDAEIDARSAKLVGRLRGVEAAQHVAVAHRMELRSTGGQDDVVCVYVQHLAVGESDDHHRARVHADDVVAQLAGEHRDIAAIGTPYRCSRLA